MKNRAFVKYRKNGEIVPGSLIITNGGYPKGGPYKEITVDLCCDTSCDNTNFGFWKAVTGGGAGDGVVLVDGSNRTNPNNFTIVGPNDDPDDNGWVYVKRQFPEGARISIYYSWTSFDDGVSVDCPVYWTSSTEPTGIPADITSKASTTPESDTWIIIVPPGEWFAVGIYSTDSCCGRGFLDINIDALTYYYIEYQIPSNPFSITNPYVKLSCDGNQVVYQYVTGGGPYTTLDSLADAFNTYTGTNALGEYLNAGSNSVGLRVNIDTLYNVCTPTGVLTLEIGED